MIYWFCMIFFLHPTWRGVPQSLSSCSLRAVVHDIETECLRDTRYPSRGYPITVQSNPRIRENGTWQGRTRMSLLILDRPAQILPVKLNQRGHGNLTSFHSFPIALSLRDQYIRRLDIDRKERTDSRRYRKPSSPQGLAFGIDQGTIPWAI